MAALWDDIKFDLKHFFSHRTARHGRDKKWEQGMAAFCRPFTTAKVQYIDGAALNRRGRGWRAKSGDASYSQWLVTSTGAPTRTHFFQ
jgi:hypothetical protein